MFTSEDTSPRCFLFQDTSVSQSTCAHKVIDSYQVWHLRNSGISIIWNNKNISDAGEMKPPILLSKFEIQFQIYLGQLHNIGFR